MYRFAASEVDHYLYFVVRPDRRLIAAHFGFKNAEADEYSIRLFSRFAAPDFPADRMLETGNCSMRFSFGRFFSMERPGYWRFSETANWTDALIGDLDTHLVPFVKRVASGKDVFEVLAGDEEPCPWIASNAAIRIAQVIFLGNMLHVSRERLRGIATPKLLRNSATCSKASTGGPRSTPTDRSLRDDARGGLTRGDLA